MVNCGSLENEVACPKLLAALMEVIWLAFQVNDNIYPTQSSYTAVHLEDQQFIVHIFGRTVLFFFSVAAVSKVNASKNIFRGPGKKCQGMNMYIIHFLYHFIFQNDSVSDNLKPQQTWFLTKSSEEDHSLI